MSLPPSVPPVSPSDSLPHSQSKSSADSPSPSPIVTAINIYPIKSCRGISVQSAELTPWGLQWDRQWMIVTPEGEFITQRTLPELALIEPVITAESLYLMAPGQRDFQVPLQQSDPGKSMQVTVWGDRCQAIDQGDAVAAWFSRALGTPARLVRIGTGYDRPVDAKYDRGTTAQVSFADSYPLLLISEASLEDLNQRLDEPLPMNRFRPNLVVSGCSAYAEDEWQQIQIADVLLDVVKPCTRCIITTTDQETTDRGKEPLATLSTYRRWKNGVIFGQNLIHRSRGTLAVGNAVQILS
ncbi:MOSC domain-containing protein [Leptolyngbya ohadii]|uniref:MOSC domain-containing protein n=1 Tax=Leptolyngbya ohadii TaxID=1962290 RepID=UPI000B5A1A7D|nr:MOSC N-terminal beta barrel domain-containing protein [Leptolyngbya ohadii]